MMVCKVVMARSGRNEPVQDFSVQPFPTLLSSSPSQLICNEFEFHSLGTSQPLMVFVSYMYDSSTTCMC